MHRHNATARIPEYIPNGPAMQVTASQGHSDAVGNGSATPGMKVMASAMLT